MLFLIWPGDKTAPKPVLLASIALAIVAGGVLIHGLALSRVSFAAELSRVSLLQSLSMAVMALVLLEQLFRNASEDTRWSIKPRPSLLPVVGTRARNPPTVLHNRCGNLGLLPTRFRCADPMKTSAMSRFRR